MKIYATFSGDKYHQTTTKIVADAPKYGADKVWVYDDIWLKTCRPDFMKQHANLFAKRDPRGALRGFGWFVWKPFVVLDALSRMSDGDTVLFTDADTYPIFDLSPLYSQCEKDGGIMLFHCVGQIHRWWGKRDCQHLMNQDDDHWRDRQHACARFMLFRKGSKIKFKSTRFFPEGGEVTPEEFLNEWLKYTSDIRINTFDKSVIMPEYPDLHEPRCEQAVLTNEAHRYGFKLYREACEWGNSVPEDKEIYPQTFVQVGGCSYDPKPNPGQKGSRFRNIND